ncbi:MAG: acetylglutamate kinase [Robiginitalea sp.]|uniref:acetylglutamate kinase n=1 Tax=Robiginitalea sp. TaxID=1902411 RepID=UPI003C726716
MKQKVEIIKIGGAFLEDDKLLDMCYSAFSAMEGLKILVHGGGQRASKLSSDLGITPQMVHGRRITDIKSLEVVTMVYAGWANKTLVAGLQGRGCNALGLSGADANLIRAQKRPVTDIDYGLVGDVKQVNTDGLSTLLNAGFTPVFCALTHDGNGQLLNTNADSIAAELAMALSATYEIKLIYCFEKQGVLRDVNDPESVIPQIDTENFKTLQKEGVISAGMIPKLFNSFRALQAGVDQVYIGPVSLLSGQAPKYTQIRL